MSGRGLVRLRLAAAKPLIALLHRLDHPIGFTSLQLVQVHYGEGVVNRTGPGVFPPAWARQITTESGAMHATEPARE